MAKTSKLTDRQIAERLDEVRLENGWSYRELGEHIGAELGKPTIPEPTVRKFLQGAGHRPFRDTTVYPLRRYVENLPAQESGKSAGLVEARA